MAAVGTGMMPASSGLVLEQSGARSRAGGRLRRRHRRRHARQRRQSARLRGPLRAAAGQGQGQQRLLRGRAVPAPVRRHASRSTTCARIDGRADVEGEDDFRWRARPRWRRSAATRRIWSRRCSRASRYPDGAVLFLGTMFAPVEDRDAPGKGFTHKPGDIVTIATPDWVKLVNRIRPTDQCERWPSAPGADAQSRIPRATAMSTDPADGPILGTLYGSDAMRAVFDETRLFPAHAGRGGGAGPGAGAPRHHSGGGRRRDQRGGARSKTSIPPNSPPAPATSAIPWSAWSRPVARRRRGRRVDPLGRDHAGHHGHRHGVAGRDGLALIRAELLAIVARADDAGRAHRDTVMAGARICNTRCRSPSA